MKKSAIAYPIQGLIKYHGLKDEKLRIPFHDSISVCTAPTHTHTPVGFGRVDDIEIDGKSVDGRAKERCLDVINAVRELSGSDKKIKVVSKNNFPSNIGLGASSSGFAALALATAALFGLDTNDKKLMSQIARRGAGSAARSMTGGFSIWKTGDDSYSEQLSDIKEFSWHALSCLGCSGWGRVDLIKDVYGNFQLLEINTVPGLTEASLVPKSSNLEGIDFNNLILRILNTA